MSRDGDVQQGAGQCHARGQRAWGQRACSGHFSGVWLPVLPLGFELGGRGLAGSSLITVLV